MSHPTPYLKEWTTPSKLSSALGKHHDWLSAWMKSNGMPPPGLQTMKRGATKRVIAVYPNEEFFGWVRNCVPAMPKKGGAR